MLILVKEHRYWKTLAGRSSLECTAFVAPRTFSDYLSNCIK